jgi:hypothetical protein
MADQSSVRGRALGAVLQNALLSWQTLVTVVITAILFLFVPQPIEVWQPWFWLVLGGLAELAFIASNLSNPEAAAAALTREFEAKYDLNEIRNVDARQRLERALEYRRSMLKLTEQHDGAMRTQLQQTVADVNDWIGHMYDLALHIDAFAGNELVRRDQAEVPRKLAQAKRELNAATDNELKRDLEERVRSLELQQDNLRETENGMKRAEIQLDNTLASLGTIYAQMSRLGTKDVDSAKAQRLRLEIQDEVTGLQDTIDALEEVQAQRLRMR